MTTTTTSAHTFFDTYLTERGISLEVAKELGWRPLTWREIAEVLGIAETRAAKMGSGIFINLGDGRAEIRIERPELKEFADIAELKAFAKAGWAETPRLGSEWRRKALGDLHYADGVHSYGSAIVSVSCNGTQIKQVGLNPLKWVAKTKKFLRPRGQSAVAYAPVAVRGNRPLLIVEGSSRVLAALAQGLDIDVVGIQGCTQWQPAIALAATATEVVVCLDGDVLTNPQVRRQLHAMAEALAATPNAPSVRWIWPGSGATGLDDALAAGLKLDTLIRGALPVDPWAAAKIVAEDWDLERTVAGRPGPADLHWLGVDLDLVTYERWRQAFARLDIAPHPAPEGRVAKSSDLLAVADVYVLPRLAHAISRTRRGQAEVWSIRSDRLVDSVHRDSLLPKLTTICGALLGTAPDPVIIDKIRSHALNATTLEVKTPVSIRWASERSVLALAELPDPAPIPTPTWDAFFARCSCAKTVLAWLWTLTLPEEQTGRQVLYFEGGGEDGKSTLLEAMHALVREAPVSATFKAGDQSQFGLQMFSSRTRLVAIDDIRNAAFLHYQDVRNLAAGASMRVEKKGKDAEIIYLHPRMLLAGNAPLKFDLADRAEVSRFLHIKVKPMAAGVVREGGYKAKLIAEFGGILHRAKAAYAELARGNEITWTPETRAVMEGAAIDPEEEFGPVVNRIEFGADYRITVARLNALLDEARIVDDRAGSYKRTNFLKFLASRGAEKAQAKIGGTKVKVWRGIGIKGELVVSAETSPGVESIFGVPRGLEGKVA